MTSRHCIALLCLAVLFLAVLTPAASLLLWAVLPFCFVFSLMASIVGFVDTERETLRPDFSLLLPARAPPMLS